MIAAPVCRFEAIVDRGGGRISGYAAPARGMAPCWIQVRNGGRIVAAAAAKHFVSADCRVRLGWCGFTLPLGTGLFLFDDEAELVCGASGRSLLKLVLDSSALPDELVPAPVAIPTSVLALAHAQPDHAPVEGMVRLVQAVVSRTSVEKGVHALYKMLLLRDADDLGLHNYRPRMTSMAGIEQVMRSIMDSEEYARLPLGSRFASPFHSADATEPLLALAESEVGPSPTPGEADDPGEVISLRDLVMADRENWRQVEDSQLRLGSRSPSTWGGPSAKPPAGDEEWMARIAAALLASPSWWGLMPKSWRHHKMSERLQSSGLFDGPAYLHRNPDVAKAGMDPLKHYLSHGRHEGRNI